MVPPPGRALTCLSGSPVCLRRTRKTSNALAALPLAACFQVALQGRLAGSRVESSQRGWGNKKTETGMPSVVGSAGGGGWVAVGLWLVWKMYRGQREAEGAGKEFFFKLSHHRGRGQKEVIIIMLIEKQQFAAQPCTSFCERFV